MQDATMKDPEGNKEDVYKDASIFGQRPDVNILCFKTKDSICSICSFILDVDFYI